MSWNSLLSLPNALLYSGAITDNVVRCFCTKWNCIRWKACCNGITLKNSVNLFNYKKKFSSVLMALVEGDLRFITIDVRDLSTLLLFISSFFLFSICRASITFSCSGLSVMDISYISRVDYLWVIDIPYLCTFLLLFLLHFLVFFAFDERIHLNFSKNVGASLSGLGKLYVAIT